MTGPRPRSLRLAAAVLAGAAALAAAAGREAEAVRVLAVDASRSVAGDAAGVERALALAGEGAAVLAFGPAAVEAAAPGRGGGPPALPPAEGEGTDLEAAIRAALARIPRERPGEILLATDGRATRGDAGAAVAEALARGVGIRTVPLGDGPRPPRAAAVDAPPSARSGERFPVDVTVTGGAGTRGEVLLEDVAAGTSTRRPFVLPVGGRARVSFEARSAAPGVRRFRASVPGPLGGAAPEAAVLVEGPAAVLRLGRVPAGAGTGAILRAVAGEGARDAAGPPAAAEALRTVDLAALGALVLDDLPEADLPAGAGERIARAVEGGLGLLVLGGPGTLGPGGWAGRPLEEALPVRCAPERPRPLLVLALDASGSMAEAGLEAAAREAAAAVAARLPGEVLLALVRFSDRADPAAGPFDLSTAAGREEAVAAAGGRYGAPRGGTRFGAAAEGAREAAARARGSGARTLLLVTDGRPAEPAEELRALGASLAAARFAVGLVAVGSEADEGRLGAFLGAAGGTRGRPGEGLAEALLRLSAAGDGALWHEGPVAVRPGPDPAPWGTGPAGLPPAAGFDRVFPREGARVWLSLEGGEPLLAAGARGLGRSAVFAAPPAAGSGEWASPPAAALLEEALRWALRSPGTAAAEGRVRRLPGGGLRALLETLPAAAPAGEVRAAGAALRRTGPSRWEGTLPAGAEGEEGVVAFESGGAVLARAAVAPEAPGEDLLLGPDPRLLSALEVPARSPRGDRGGAGPAALAAGLAALALLLAAGARDGTSSRGGPSVGRG